MDSSGQGQRSVNWTIRAWRKGHSGVECMICDDAVSQGTTIAFI